MKKIYTLILPLLCVSTTFAQPEFIHATPIAFGGGGQSSFQSQTQGSSGSTQTVTSTTQSQVTSQAPQVRSQSSQMRVAAPAARASQQYVAVANPQIVPGAPQQVVTSVPQQVVRVAPVNNGGIGDRKLFIDNLYNKIQLAKQAPHASSQGRYAQLAQDSVVYDLLREHPDLSIGSLVFQPVNNSLPNAADLRRGEDFYRRKFGNRDYTLREITSLIDQDVYNVNNPINDDWIMLADALQLTRDATSDRPSIMGDLLSEYILLGKIKILEGRPNLTPQDQTLLITLYDDLLRVYQSLPQNQAVLATSDFMLVQPVAQEYMAVQTVTTPNGTMQTGQTDQTTTTVQTNTTGTTAGAGGGGGGGYIPPVSTLPPAPAPAPRRYRSASSGGSVSSAASSAAAAASAPAPAPAPAPSVDTTGITNSILAGIGNITAGLGGGGGGGGGYNNYDGGGNTNYGGGGSNQNDSPNTNSMAPVNITVQGASITGGSVGDTTGGSAAGGTGGSANTKGGSGAGGSGGLGGSANTKGGDGAGGTGGAASGGSGGSANTTSGSATGATGGTANTQGGNIKTKGGNVKGGNVDANANANAKANVRIGKNWRNKNTPNNTPPLNTPPGNTPPGNTPPGNTPPITGQRENCQKGYKKEGGTCVPKTPRECPKGQRMEGGTCVPKTPRECPKGQRMEGGTCVAKTPKVCPKGYRTLEDGKTCEKNTTATPQRAPNTTTATPGDVK